MQIVMLFLVGLVVGVTGRGLTRRAPGEPIIAVLLATAGAMVAAVLGRSAGLFESMIEGPAVLAALLGAMSLVVLYSRVVLTKRHA